MRVLVYEHLTGGGQLGADIPASTLSEGYAMLSSAIKDFKAAGSEVVTTLDPRLASLSPPLDADHVSTIPSRSRLMPELREILGNVDAALIVAPESGGVLADLVGFVEDLDEARSLNSPSEAIRAVSDKMATYETLRERGLRVPRTKRLDGGSSVEEVNQAVRDMVFPLVFKLGEGEGCRGLSVVEGGSQIPKAVEKLGRVASASSLLVQELVEGVPASVNLISDGERALPLSLNLQELVLSGPDSDSGYLGGVVPLDHPSKDEALGAAEKCVESFTGLKGYMGVDMVLTREGPVVMEINPRLTTSYIGLREVVDINVAYAVVDAGLRGKLPGRLRHIGHAYFSKIAVQKPSLETLKNIYGMEGVAVPPFPIPSEERAYAIIVTHASTVKEAEGRFRAAEARLEGILSKGG